MCYYNYHDHHPHQGYNQRQYHYHHHHHRHYDNNDNSHHQYQYNSCSFFVVVVLFLITIIIIIIIMFIITIFISHYHYHYLHEIATIFFIVIVFTPSLMIIKHRDKKIELTIAGKSFLRKTQKIFLYFQRCGTIAVCMCVCRAVSRAELNRKHIGICYRMICLQCSEEIKSDKTKLVLF